jgi:hypothetical protein
MLQVYTSQAIMVSSRYTSREDKLTITGRRSRSVAPRRSPTDPAKAHYPYPKEVWSPSGTSHLVYGRNELIMRLLTTSSNKSPAPYPVSPPPLPPLNYRHRRMVVETAQLGDQHDSLHRRNRTSDVRRLESQRAQRGAFDVSHSRAGSRSRARVMSDKIQARHIAPTKPIPSQQVGVYLMLQDR